MRRKFEIHDGRLIVFFDEMLDGAFAIDEIGHGLDVQFGIGDRHQDHGCCAIEPRLPRERDAAGDLNLAPLLANVPESVVPSWARTAPERSVKPIEAIAIRFIGSST